VRGLCVLAAYRQMYAALHDGEDRLCHRRAARTAMNMIMAMALQHRLDGASKTTGARGASARGDANALSEERANPLRLPRPAWSSNCQRSQNCEFGATSRVALLGGNSAVGS
jgi:hypothetical protein